MDSSLIHSLWEASALMLVIEGIMPFLNPTVFKRALRQMVSMDEHQIRMIGLLSMFLGLAVLYWVN